MTKRNDINDSRRCQIFQQFPKVLKILITYKTSDNLKDSNCIRAPKGYLEPLLGL